MTEEDEERYSTQDKALDQVIVETVRDGRVLLGKLFGEAVTEFGGMLGEQMRYWRFLNMSRILSRVEEIRKSRGHDIESLSSLGFGEAFRTIEAASFEEEEEIQELWAGLISNAAAPDSTVTIKKVYIEILRSLSPPEAALMELIEECESRARWFNPHELKAFNDDMNKFADMRWRKHDANARRTAIQNLVRIRCMVFRPQPLNIDRMLAEMPRDTIRSSFTNWSVVDPRRFQEFITELVNMMHTAVGVREFDASKPIPLQGGLGFGYGRALSVEVPEMNFMLTALGKDILRACKTDRNAKDDAT